jgi:hypothetical protein
VTPSWSLHITFSLLLNRFNMVYLMSLSAPAEPKPTFTLGDPSLTSGLLDHGVRVKSLVAGDYGPSRDVVRCPVEPWKNSMILVCPLSDLLDTYLPARLSVSVSEVVLNIFPQNLGDSWTCVLAPTNLGNDPWEWHVSPGVQAGTVFSMNMHPHAIPLQFVSGLASQFKPPPSSGVLPFFHLYLRSDSSFPVNVVLMPVVTGPVTYVRKIKGTSPVVST